MICKNCGALVNSEQKYCEYCGGEIEHPKPQNVIINNYNYTTNNSYNTNRTVAQTNYKQCSNKNWVVALVLCVVFGIFGFHKFYVGKTGMGIIYLFTGGLFCIGWIVDIILIVTDKFTDKYGLPLLQK
jgi:TM2 domain-containing membrane protein YozV